MNRVLLRYELLALLRDTRTLFLSVLLPIILLPVLLFTLSRLSARAVGESDEAYHYGRSHPGLEQVVETSLDSSRFREMLVGDGEEMLDEGHLDLLIKVAPPQKVDPDLGRDIAEMFPELSTLVDSQQPGQPIVELLYRSDRERSVRAYLLAMDQILQYRDERLSVYLDDQGADVGFTMTSHDMSFPQERAARRYGPALSAFMVLMLLGGGSVAALDSLAGERERGTLSTLFVSSLDRRSIAWSKFCAVSIISVAVALVQILNLIGYAVFGFVDWPMDVGMHNGFAVFVALFSLFTAEAVFTASLLLYISARSHSFKEAQLFFFPTFLVSFALSLSGLMPALVSRSVVSLIPFTGPGVFIPEVLAGRMDVPVLILQLAVHLAGSYFLLRSTVARMESEGFLGGEAPLHGEALRFEEFSQRALPFFAFLAAALFVVPSNFEALSTLKGQGVFNQLVLFVLGPLLLLSFFKQKVSRAVPIRMPDPRILLACLALIPLGQLAATGLSHLVGPLLPAPVKALEMMMEMLDIEHTPPWQLFLLIGVMPGICEEFAFRGVLLHSLHKRFNPWTLAFVVALVFGFFHVNFFRILPTAFLGFVLALLTLATGSVLPGMIVHIGNNSLAVWAMLHGIDFEGLDPWIYGVALIGQVVLVGLIIYWGPGYPGTRWAKNKSGN